MMMPRHIAIIFTILSLFTATRTAQAQHRIQFSQYMFNRLVLNPAYAGMEQVPSITVYNRSQWSGADGAPKTQSLSAHGMFTRERIGAGLVLVHDEIGIHENYRISGAFAYHVRLGDDSRLSFGMSAGLAHREGNYAELGSAALQDPKVGTAAYVQNNFEVGAGLYFRTDRFQLGFSSPQMLSEKFELGDSVSFATKTKQLYVFSGYRIPLTASLEIEPGFLLKYLQGAPMSYDVNANLFIYKVIIAGVSYRKKESVDFLLRAQITSRMQIGYGYDHVIGDVSSFATASHELMLNYQFRHNRKAISSPR